MLQGNDDHPFADHDLSAETLEAVAESMSVTRQGVEAYLQTRGILPVNVKFMLEGQEEMGSVDLSKTVEKNKDLFSADYALR